MASPDAGSPVNREDLLQAVGNLAGLESTETAERATLATLRTLGEHVTAGEAADLAERLPDRLAAAVTEESDEAPESFSVDEFVDRVADREGDGRDDRAAVTRRVRAVHTALAENGLENELQEVREQLPNEYASLFEREGLATDAE